jgi:hypothetical protein
VPTIDLNARDKIYFVERSPAIAVGSLRRRAATLVTVMFGVGFCSLCRMVRCVVQMTLCGMAVVRRRLVIVSLVMRCRFTVMPRRVFMVFRCFVMVLCRLLGHCFLLMNACGDGAAPPYSPNVTNI